MQQNVTLVIIVFFIIHRSLRHRNVVNFLGACLVYPRIGIVTEFCEHGSLRILMKSQKLNLHMKYRILTDVASGMAFLHSKNCIHRDLKCDNILVDKYYNCKLTDFGLAKLKSNNNFNTKHVGTR